MVSVAQLYMVLARSFFGRTIGEWTFELQLGNAFQQRAWWYPLAVVWRSTLNICTGFVVLPILSLLVQRDVSAFPSGVRIYRLK